MEISPVNNVPWNVFFTFVCWHIWNWRCKSVFDSSFKVPFDMRKVICSYIEERLRANMKNCSKAVMQLVMLHWSKPSNDFLKLNVDGARSRRGSIGAGGVLRDAHGSWRGGFIANLGSGEVLQAEAWGMLHGVQMAQNFGAAKIFIKSDSSILIKRIKDADIVVHPLGTIVENCRRLLQGFEEAVIKHVYREQNLVADLLAKDSLDMKKGICLLEEAPAVVAGAVFDDAVGLGRLCSIRTELHH